MKSISPRIYTKKYYLSSCLGFEEFKTSKLKKVNKRVVEFANLVPIKKGVNILDLGCGRGGLAIECARRGANVIGIDYSKDGIALAKLASKSQRKEIKDRVNFYVMNSKRLKFKKDFFDAIISFDVFEHLYDEELQKTMREISRVLKPKGTLLVHTEPNKIYLDFTHKAWVYPWNFILIWGHRFLTRKNYSGLDANPRNELHKVQHINEPTYFYLKNLFEKHKFSGKIIPVIPYKPLLSWKDFVYNFLVWLYPISALFPFHLLFAYDYIAIMINNNISTKKIAIF